MTQTSDEDKLTAYVVDHHPLMRDSMALLLRRIRPKSTVIGLSSVNELLFAPIKHGPADLICMELNFPDSQGLSGLRLVRSINPLVPVVIFTDQVGVITKNQCIESGADLFIEKNATVPAIVKLLSELPVLAVPAGWSYARVKLSRREKELLVLADLGMSTMEIARALALSTHGIKVTFYRMFQRLGVHSRMQALRYARDHGWL